MRILLIIASILLIGCQQPSTPVSKIENTTPVSTDINVPVKDPTAKNKNMLWLIAHVQYFEFEGGFYGLVTTDKKRYLPLNLPVQFQQHNAKVRFTGKAKPDLLTTTQWGTPFDIKTIELIKKGTLDKTDDGK